MPGFLHSRSPMSSLVTLILSGRPGSGPSGRRLHVRRARSLYARLMGWMGRKRLPPGEGLWLHPCHAIHTCFMRSEIDVAFLDQWGGIVACHRRLPPWRFVRVWHARSAIELPPGTIRRMGLRPGLRLVLLTGIAGSDRG